MAYTGRERSDFRILSFGCRLTAVPSLPESIGSLGEYTRSPKRVTPLAQAGEGIGCDKWKCRISSHALSRGMTLKSWRPGQIRPESALILLRHKSEIRVKSTNAERRFVTVSQGTLPPCGGMGAGVVQYGTTVPHRTTPAPIPPQGGGEEFAEPANQICDAVALTPSPRFAALNPGDKAADWFTCCGEIQHQKGAGR